MRSAYFALGLGSSFCLGSAIGYLVAQKRLELKYKVIADEEIQSVKEHYALLRKDGLYSDPTTIAKSLNIHKDYGEVKDAEEIIDANQYSFDSLKGPQGSEEEKHNVFEGNTEGRDPGELESPELEDDEDATDDLTHDFESSDPDTYWNWDEELERREEEPDKPYVITLAEYMAGEKGYEQTCLTYYDGDDVLTDERDTIIEDIEGTVGRVNMLRFGHASDDRNIVYIRNDRISLDFEIAKSDGKYAEEVLGYVEHSDKPRGLRKFRDYD